MALVAGDRASPRARLSGATGVRRARDATTGDAGGAWCHGVLRRTATHPRRVAMWCVWRATTTDTPLAGRVLRSGVSPSLSCGRVATIALALAAALAPAAGAQGAERSRDPRGGRRGCAVAGLRRSAAPRRRSRGREEAELERLIRDEGAGPMFIAIVQEAIVDEAGGSPEGALTRDPAGARPAGDVRDRRRQEVPGRQRRARPGRRAAARGRRVRAVRATRASTRRSPNS